MAFRASTKTELSTAGTTLTINVPTVVDGDMMMLCISLATSPGTAVFTTPGGWTLLYRSASGNVVWYYRVASSEPGSYAPTWDITARGCATMETHSGIDTTDPFAAIIFGGSLNANAPYVGPIGMSNATDCDLTSYHVNGQGTVTTISQPGGFTLSQDARSGTASAAGTTLGLAIKDVTAGTAAAASWTLTGGTSGRQAYILWRRTTTAAAIVRSYSQSGFSAVAPISASRPAGNLSKDGDLCLIIAFSRSLAAAPVLSSVESNGFTRVFATMPSAPVSNGGFYEAFWKVLTSSDSTWNFAWSSAPNSTVVSVVVLSGQHAAIPIGGGTGKPTPTTSSTSWSMPAFTMGKLADPGAMLIGFAGEYSTTAFSNTLGSSELWTSTASGGVTQCEAGLGSQSAITGDAPSDTWTLPSGAGAIGQIAILPNANAPGNPGARGITHRGRN